MTEWNQIILRQHFQKRQTNYLILASKETFLYLKKIIAQGVDPGELKIADLIIYVE